MLKVIVIDSIKINTNTAPPQSETVCVAMAALMHFAFLTAFMWMGIESYTLYLQVQIMPDCQQGTGD